MNAVVGRVFVLLAVGASGRLEVTPVDRVISLLTKLSAQVQSEGAEEAASYDKYACFCKDEADSKVYDIAKSDKKIGELDASITKLESEISQLDSDVAKNKDEVEKEEKIQEEKQKARTADQEEYEKKRKDLAEAVTAVEEALAAMQHSQASVEEVAASLVQRLPVGSLSSAPMLALIADAKSGKRFTGSATPAGQPKGYEYQSKEIIATLQSLEVTFKNELAELDKSEITAQGDFEMLAGARSNTIKAINKDSAEKEMISASKGEEKSDKEELKNQETIARNADQSFLDDLTSKCEKKAKAWDQRSTTRASELTALTQAVELLKGMGDLYSTNSKLVGMISTGSHTTFLQVRSVRRHGSAEAQLQSLLNHLQEKASSLKSTPLTMLALRLKMAGPDHFVKVRGLIKDLIAKLEADAAAEATAKSVCDKNMKEAIEQRDEAAANYETAGAQIDTTTANINSLKSEISTLSEDIAHLNMEMKEMTELRAKEKAENEKTIANANQGKSDVDLAIKLLNDFYENALVQTGADPKKNIEDREGKTVGDLAPDTFSSDEEYKGKAESSKGIIGMLEVISSDFERTSKTTADAEKQSEEDFKMLKDETEKSIADKEKLKKQKEGDVETKESELTQLKEDKRTAKKMNDQAMEELEKLSSSCVDSGETWAERKQHREEEIEALKQALQILEDWKS